MDTEWIWVWRGLYVASFVLILNGFAEIIGKAIKERYDWKQQATSFLRIGLGILFMLIAGIFIWINFLNNG